MSLGKITVTLKLLSTDLDAKGILPLHSRISYGKDSNSDTMCEISKAYLAEKHPPSQAQTAGSL